MESKSNLKIGLPNGGRSAEFTTYSIGLAEAGYDFNEIAGNTGNIVVSILASEDWVLPSEDYSILMSQPILTSKNKQRFVVEVPVKRLSEFLRSISQLDVQIEHVYDF